MKIKTSTDGGRYLNLGCGAHFFDDWNNLDLLVHPNIVYFDVTRTLPYPENSFDATYSSHVLEHLEPEMGHRFLAEQFRVLKPGGVCRIAVPDLERICRDYLAQLESVSQDPRPENEMSYDWSVLQLFDQMVRQAPGGEMRKAIEKGAYDEAWVRSRFGEGALPPKAVAGRGRQIWSWNPEVVRSKGWRFFRRLIGGRPPPASWARFIAGCTTAIRCSASWLNSGSSRSRSKRRWTRPSRPGKAATWIGRRMARSQGSPTRSSSRGGRLNLTRELFPPAN